MRWISCAALCLALLHVVMTLPTPIEVIEVIPAQQISLSPEEVFGPIGGEILNRDKRKIVEPLVSGSFGVKSFILNLVFGKVNQLLDFKFGLVNQLDRANAEKNKALLFTKPCDVPSSTTRTPISTTPDDVPDFNPDAVSLELPGEVFGSTVSLVSKGSKIIGDVIMNTALRAQRFVEAFKPYFGGKFGIESSRGPSQPRDPAIDPRMAENLVDGTR